MSWFGLLNVNKPSGLSSRRAVDPIERLVRPEKAGHAGTLDPLAKGVLVVCVGSATRLIEYVQQMPKRYRATFELGCSSPTEDTEGEITPLVDPPVPTLAEIEAHAARMTGEILQRPPIFSALKIGGRPAYKSARAGQEVELAPRKIVVHAIEILHYEYPKLVLDIRCGSGTYVRSLGRDLAESLGTAAVMTALERTAIGPFRVEDAISPLHLTSEKLAQHLLPAALAVAALPQITLTPEEAVEIAHGRLIDRAAPDEGPEIAALNASGELLAIVTPKQGRLGPLRNFPRPV